MTKTLRRKNFFTKFLTKVFNRKAYYKYKADHWSYGLRNYTDRHKVLTAESYQNIVTEYKNVNLVHNGHTGDIIYSLPTAKEICRITGAPVNFYLNIGYPSVLKAHHKHPSGSVMLSRDVAKLLIPLIASQPYINICEIYEEQRVDLNLSKIRELGIFLDKGSISRWYNYLSGLYPSTSCPWIFVEPDQVYSDKIVIARSHRYRNPYIDYRFLSKYKNVMFVGLESEYLEIRDKIRGIRWQPVNDFLELARIISGSMLFIGNQSFPFAVAEGTKVARILEIAAGTPNVIPEGGIFADFYFQEHFEELTVGLIESLLKRR